MLSLERFNSIGFQEQGIATGPPPELWADLPKPVESARPGTRRSRMRSRAGNSTSDEGNMSAPAGFLEVDHLSNIPITVTSDNSTVNVTAAFPKQPSIQQQHCSSNCTSTEVATWASAACSTTSSETLDD